MRRRKVKNIRMTFDLIIYITIVFTNVLRKSAGKKEEEEEEEKKPYLTHHTKK